MMDKGTILIVDDDKDITASLKVVLEAQGFKTCSAITGHEAIEKLKTALPDLIILDVMLEGMSDGFDLARQLKNQDLYKKIPIVIVTALGEKTGFHFDANIDREKWLPVDAYFEKPVDFQILIAEIEKLLKR
jgi:DNA-binding response OmpR family regulator